MHIALKGILPSTNQDDLEDDSVCINFAKLLNVYYQPERDFLFLTPTEMLNSLPSEQFGIGQHDASECIIFILDNLLSKYHLTDSFKITHQSTLRCCVCDNKSIKVDNETILQLSVAPSLAASISAYVETEYLIDGNEPFCDRCNRKQKTGKFIQSKLNYHIYFFKTLILVCYLYLIQKNKLKSQKRLTF
jgi:hypothetical protein